MILHLLFPLLILYGAVESQTANMTEEWWSKAEQNQTFNVSPMYNSTLKPDNVTSSLYKNNKSNIEDELQKNQTSVITEDDENFQDQENEFPAKYCLWNKLIEYSKVFCVEPFHRQMQEISTEKWCVLENIIRPYNKMTLCLEEVSHFVGCFYPNPDIQDLFVNVHYSYFHTCTQEDLLLKDAPHWLVVTLTLIPVSLIPALVYLVVWKSKVQD